MRLLNEILTETYEYIALYAANYNKLWIYLRN